MTDYSAFLGLGSASAIDIATLLLRVSLGGLFIAHAWLKYAVFTPAGAAGFFKQIGLPGWLAYVTILVEVLGGIALVIGLQTSLVAIVLVPVILGATIFGHRANGFWFTNENGGWEYPAFWTVALIALALLGDGALAITA